MPPVRFSKDGRKARDPKKTLLRLLSYMKNYIPHLLAVMVCIVVSAIAQTRGSQNIGNLVDMVHRRNKVCFVHLDLIEGLSNREISVDALVQLGSPDGIISTRTPQIRRAQQLGILTIQRVFLLDSMSLQSLLTTMDAYHPDFIEVLPGVIPSVIAEITAKTTIPIIAGGLIRSKQDVIQALQAGAIAVSTSCRAVWKM